MNPSMLCKTCILSLVLSFSAIDTFAQEIARIARVSVEHDGSIDPPGQVVVVKTYLFGRIKTPVLSVRGISFSEDDISKPVVGTDGFRDPNGQLLIEQAVESDGESRVYETRLVVPYSAFRLRHGIHLLAYEVSLRDDQRIISTASSTVFEIEITEQPRLSMSTGETITHSEKATLPFYDGKAVVPIEHEIRVEVPLTKHVKLSKGIDGGFKRRSTKPRQPVKRGGTARIVYATTRNVDNAGARDGSRFGPNHVDQLSCGSCDVQIPVSHSRGNLESWTLFNRDPSEYFHTLNLQGMGRAQLEQLLQTRLTEEDVLIFVHGFATEFDHAAQVLGQIGTDTEFRGQLMLMSWASRGKKGLTAYQDDQHRAAQAVPHFVSFLKSVVNKQESNGAGRVHIIAHSMGCRVISEVISKLKRDLPELRKPFGHVILAAPDVRISDFVIWHPDIAGCSDRLTIYFSNRDFALLGSQGVNLTQRIGQTGFLTRPNTPDNVDSRLVDTSWMGFGHDHVHRSVELLIDLKMILLNDKLPDDRETIQAAMTNPVKFWEFP